MDEAPSNMTGEIRSSLSSCFFCKLYFFVIDSCSPLTELSCSISVYALASLPSRDLMVTFRISVCLLFSRLALTSFFSLRFSWSILSLSASEF